MTASVELTGDEWKDEIRDKIIEVYENEAENMTRLLHFLDEEDKAWQKDERGAAGIHCPFWRTLRKTYKRPCTKVFKEYADRLIQDTFQSEMDENYRNIMREIYEGMADPCDGSEYEEPHQFKMSLTTMSERKGTQTGLWTGLLKAWENLPVQAQEGLIATVKNIGGKSNALASIDDVVSLLKGKGGSIAVVALAAVFLTYECLISLYQWWTGKITGKRCAKNCLESLASIGAGVGFAIGGSVLGTMILPGIGTAIGGIAGGVVGAMGTKYVSDLLLRKIFNLPKLVALENAYVYLGVQNNSDNNTINTAFRKMVLKCHPDKGGKVEEFYLLQMHMATIKLSREGKC